MEKVASIFTAIVGIAGVAIVVQSPFTASIIKASGAAFSGAISSAKN